MTKRKLALNKQSVRILLASELANVGGGWLHPPLSWSCPQPSQSGCCPHTE